MGEEPRTRYWKAKAEALEAANRRLYARLEALAARLPPEYLDLLEEETATGRPPRPLPPLPDAREAGGRPTPADVGNDVRSLWKRAAPLKEG